MKVTKAEREEAITNLRQELKAGDTVYTVLRSVSSSGMSRGIDVYCFRVDKAGKIRKSWLSYWVAKATGFRFNDKKDCLTIGGCGMDMGFHVIYTLGRVLFPDGFTDKNGHQRDGGYALNQEWL